ncbi:hypothetical protein Vretifemale_8730 [Volvox reticuliferus]|uniref:F5/8 type C domain-containing protein n=1 Tax=Volvox reticuliferus TaxID=1737510 RepID=A0A8J4CD48_9CHLO|nr:hypothetical protein Vretifemale_8730 [Volvox reticuliferus]
MHLSRFMKISSAVPLATSWQPVFLVVLLLQLTASDTYPLPPSPPPRPPPPSPPPRPPRPPTDGNLATGKQVYLSNSSISYANNAIDGDLASTAAAGGYDDPASWISVDLGGVWDINRILVWPYQYCCWYESSNVEVRVGLRSISSMDDTPAIQDNQLVWKQNGSTRSNPDAPWEPFVIKLQTPVKGRWVTIQNFPSYRCA